jgi:hypothetical protein
VRHVLRQVKEVNQHRVPPPSFGFDLGVVLRECFAVRRGITLPAWVAVPTPVGATGRLSLEGAPAALSDSTCRCSARAATVDGRGPAQQPITVVALLAVVTAVVLAVLLTVLLAVSDIVPSLGGGSGEMGEALGAVFLVLGVLALIG